MNILLIPDKFKGSLTNKEVITSLRKGIKKFNTSWTIYDGIVSDGGDGFLDSVYGATNVKRIECIAKDPLGRALNSYYLLDEQDEVAYIELANASGLTLLTKEERNPLKTSTYGTGLQIKDALLKGAKHIYVGIGGSATNDGGIGIASALGYKFLDANNEVLDPIGENLNNINRIDKTNCMSLKNRYFYAVNDVKNPLLGKDGAAFTYAKQKGASDEDVILLDRGLEQLSDKAKDFLSKNVVDLKGAGAAGGAGYGLHVFFDATFVDGAAYILQKSGMNSILEKGHIDLVITGEGKIDNQTVHGKLIKGVTKLAKRYGVPVIAVCGQKTLNDTRCKELGLSDIIEVADASKSLQYNMNNAATLIENALFEYLMNNSKSF